MRAVIRTEYGSADVLRLDEVATPEPGPREVRVEVRAAGVDIGAWHIMTGLPTLARLAFGVGRPKNPRIGTELAGVVDAVGADVSAFRPGDAVFGVGQGAFADYVIADPAKLARKPVGVSFEHAAASAVSGVTAMQAVVREGRLVAGQRVLVLGASGGVGSFVVQLAKSRGAQVTGVASTPKLDFVRSLGADEVLDYTTTDPTDGSVRYDLIVDMGGNRPLRKLRRALAPAGTIVIVGGEGGGRVLGGVQRGMGAGIASAFSRRRFVGLMSSTTTADLERVAELLAEGILAPPLDRVVPLTDAPAVLRDLEAGRIRGKAVLVP